MSSQGMMEITIVPMVKVAGTRSQSLRKTIAEVPEARSGSRRKQTNNVFIPTTTSTTPASQEHRGNEVFRRIDRHSAGSTAADFVAAASAVGKPDETEIDI